MNYPFYQPQMNYQSMMQPQTSYPQINNSPIIKMVNDFSEITASDVPMTSPFSLFVKNDLSEVQLRKWSANGLIDNLTFKPVLVPKVDNVPQVEEKAKYEPSDAFLEVLNNRFDAIEKLLSENSTKASTKTTRKVSDPE